MLPHIYIPSPKKSKSKSKVLDSKYSKIAPEFDYILHFDGCSKGNPGISGAGAVIYKDGTEIWNDSFFVGEYFTNNHAEYSGLLLGLQQAIVLGITHIAVKGDSLLVINQMTGVYKCHSSNIKELYETAKSFEKKFENIEFYHIDRKFNKRADQLANYALNKYLLDLSDNNYNKNKNKNKNEYEYEYEYEYEEYDLVCLNHKLKYNGEIVENNKYDYIYDLEEL